MSTVKKSFPVRFFRFASNWNERNKKIRKQTISIDPQGKIYFNSLAVGFPELGATISPLNREIPLVVRADGNIRLQIFIDVLDLLNRGGFKKVAIQTRTSR